MTEPAAGSRRVAPRDSPEAPADGHGAGGGARHRGIRRRNPRRGRPRRDGRARPARDAWLAAHRTGWLTSDLGVATWLGSTAVIVPPGGHRRRLLRLAATPVAAAGTAGRRGPALAARTRSDYYVASCEVGGHHGKAIAPRAPAVFRALFPGLADWLKSPWAGPPPFTAAQSFRVEELARDNRYVIRAELPGLDPERDIEVTVEGRTLTIQAQPVQQLVDIHRGHYKIDRTLRDGLGQRLPARDPPALQPALSLKRVHKVTVAAQDGPWTTPQG